LVAQIEKLRDDNEALTARLAALEESLKPPAEHH
jgi:ubiquinone biosynthesis protein UbiJ